MWAYAVLAGMQLVGGFQQADQIRGNAAINQSVAEMNAKYSDIDAYNATKAGFSESARYATVVDSTIGAQRAAEAGSGVAVGYGTTNDLAAASKVTGMLNMLEIHRQGREKALGYTIQGINTRLGGQMGILQGQMDASAAQNRGVLGAISTGISGYERSNTTGTGQTSRSGTNSSPRWRQSDNSQSTPSSQPAWFFGSNPSRYSQPSMSSPAGDSLFS